MSSSGGSFKVDYGDVAGYMERQRLTHLTTRESLFTLRTTGK